MDLNHFFEASRLQKNIERMKRHENCQHGSESVLIITSVLSCSCVLQPELLDTAEFRASESFILRLWDVICFWGKELTGRQAVTTCQSRDPGHHSTSGEMKSNGAKTLIKLRIKSFMEQPRITDNLRVTKI